MKELFYPVRILHGRITILHGQLRRSSITVQPKEKICITFISAHGTVLQRESSRLG